MIPYPDLNNQKQNALIPFAGLDPYEEEEALFFFGREEWCEKIISLLTGYSPIVLYGESGVGKSSLLQAGVVSHLRQLTENDRKELCIPKFAIVVFKDWPNLYQKNWLDELVIEVGKSVANAIEDQPNNLQLKVKEIEDRSRERAKKDKYPLPSMFTQKLAAWAEIIRDKYRGDGRLLIILDQFEGYFQNYSQDQNDLLKEFSEAVNAVNLPASFLFAIQSDEFYRLEQQLKSHIPTILNTCLELKHLDIEQAKEAIKKPIERYNFFESLKNSSLTVLSSSSNVSRSLMLQAGIIPYWNRLPSSTHILFNNWSNDPLSNLVEQVKQECIKIFGNQSLKNRVSECIKLYEVLQLWQEFIEQKSLDCKPSRRNLLIIFDQFENYLEKDFSQSIRETFKNELFILFKKFRYSVSILISIHYKDNLSKLQYFLNLFKNISNWSNEYFNLLEDQSLAIKSFNGSKSSKLKKIYIEDKVVKEITEALHKIGKEQHGIMAPYLQLVMTKLWKADNFFSLEAVKNCRETKKQMDGSIANISDNEKIIYGIYGIVKEYVDETAQNLEAKIIQKYTQDQKKSREEIKKLETLKTVHRLLYYLSTPSGSKHVLSAKEVAAYVKEDSKLLDVPNLEENNIVYLFEELKSKRILRSVNSPKDNEKCYEIYFDGLSKAIQDCRGEYINQLRHITYKQNLPINALAKLRRVNIESAAVSALAAYNAHKKTGYPTSLASVYEALQGVLKSDYLSCRIEDRSSEKWSFWQVTCHPKESMMVASRNDGTVWLWTDLDQYPNKYKSFKAHDDSSFPAYDDTSLHILNIDIALAFNPEGTILASSSRDKHIKLWDVEELKLWARDGILLNSPVPILDISPEYACQLLTLTKTHRKKISAPDQITSLSFRVPNGDILAAGDWKGNIWLWDVSDRANPRPKIQHPLRAGKNGNWIWSVAFSSDGETLAAGSSDGFIYCWDIKNFTTLRRPKILQDHLENMKSKGDKGREIYSVAFSPDGRWLASGSKDNTISLWEFKGKKEKPQFRRSLPGHKQGVRVVTFSSDMEPGSKKLISASEDQTIKIWNLENFTKEKTLYGHRHCVRSVVCKSSNPLHIISCGWDRTIRSWIKTKTEPEIIEEHKKDVVAVAFTSEQTLVSVSSDGTVKGLGELTLPSMKDKDKIAAAFFIQEKKILKFALSTFGRESSISNKEDTTVLIYDCQKPEFPSIKIETEQEISSLAFSFDGRVLVSWGQSRKNSIKIWDISQPKLPPKDISYKDIPYNEEVASLVFHPKDYILATGSKAGNIKLWNWNEYNQVINHGDVYSHPKIFGIESPFILAFSPDGKWLASGSDNSIIQIWQVHEPNQLHKFRELLASTYWVSSLAFSPDGKWLASGFYDGNIQVWDVSDCWDSNKSENTILLIKEHTEPVTILSFNPDGKKLLSGSSDNILRLWTIDIEELAKKISANSSLRYRSEIIEEIES